MLKNLWIISGGIFDKNKVESKIAKFEKKILEEGFWKDKENATKIIKLKKNFEHILNSSFLFEIHLLHKKHSTANKKHSIAVY